MYSVLCAFATTRPLVDDAYENGSVRVNRVHDCERPRCEGVREERGGSAWNRAHDPAPFRPLREIRAGRNRGQLY